MKNDTRHLYKNGFRNTPGVRYLTGDELRKLQIVLLSILKDFIEVAERHNLTYTLGGGSALGAVRHGGFIPWDDDIDVMMPRSDYNRFYSLFEKEMGEKYILCTPESGRNHGLAHVQIKKRGTILRSFNEISKPDEECGIMMDIFICENMFNNRFLRTIHGFICLVTGFLLTCRKTAGDFFLLQQYLYRKNIMLYMIVLIKALIGFCVLWIPLDMISTVATNCYSLCKNNSSNKVGIPSGRKHFFGEIYDRDALFETYTTEFEGIKVRIPGNHNKYLSTLYGDNYREIPHTDEQESHPIMKLVF